MSKFQQGKIYKLVSDLTDDIYIGSTCMSLAERLREHQKAFRNRPEKGLTAYSVLKYGDCRIELIEQFKCDEKYELLQREAYHIKHEPNSVNKKIPGRTDDESKAIWFQNNKHKRNQQVICECGLEVSKLNLKRHSATKRHSRAMNSA